MEFYEPLRRNASDLSTVDETRSREMLCAVFHPISIVSILIEFVGVNVDFTAFGINQNKVTFPDIRPRQGPKSPGRQNLAQQWHLLVRQCNIQVAMIARLPAHQSVDRPSAVHINLEALLLKQIDQFDGVLGSHSISVTKHGDGTAVLPGERAALLQSH